MIIRPPIGDPTLQDGEYWIQKKRLYSKRQLPHHWYNMIKGVLINMGLNPSSHDPCLLSGIFTNHSYPANNSYLQSQLHIVLFVKNVVVQSSNPALDAIFTTLLLENI